MNKGLSREGAEHMVRYLAYFSSLDEEAQQAEIQRIKAEKIGTASEYAATADQSYLRKYCAYYFEHDEAGRLVEQDRLESIQDGGDRYYMLEKSITALNMNFCDIANQTNDTLDAIAMILSDELPEIRKAVDAGSPPIRGIREGHR